MRYRQYIYNEKPKSPVKKNPTKSTLAIHTIKDKNRAEEIDKINLGGNMSIWHVTLETGYEELIFAESYDEAIKKAEHNQDNPTYKSSGFEIFYTLIKDIRDIRDDLQRIKQVIKIPEEE